MKKIISMLIPPLFYKLVEKISRKWKILKIRKRIIDFPNLHLGSGLYHVYDDFLNLDFQKDSQKRYNYCTWDLTIPLRLGPNVLDFVYTEHFVEHIKKYQFIYMMEDIFNSLKTNGVLRISTPDLETLVWAYQNNELNYWSDMNWRPTNSTDLINEGMHSWGHCYLWSMDEISRVLTEIGFKKVYRCDWRKSEYNILRDKEGRAYHKDLIIEAIK